ncbi:CPBP family intramembrane glutamic endopeptidase [Alkaliphilus serpentinus]|uniref:CPBP family intramembrane metalloprotease n=1 Tax=Alkaliphilus serpentinus TaxID=1482731 RepID=A0A833M9J4_9FIRM|nr:type II CAAX endopeptidase family protein [Alkaliphilus serpentinus]KAB3530015.1 CPBP family intramembrane metalloprotease [Alkaliphilus serpentinus]
MEKRFIIISSILACLFLYYVEQIMATSYIIKTLLKIILFTAIPYIYIRYIEKSSLKKHLKFKGMMLKQLKLGLLLGSIAFVVIIITYITTKDIIDFNGIIQELENKSKITPANFIAVGLYITFGNSFLEEFFFRGFVFLNLYNLKNKWLAYIFSSTLFAIYHIGIFKTWFNIWLTGLALIGLIVTALVLNWLNTKSQSFLNSWIVHILADSAIILIGMRLFKII